MDLTSAAGPDDVGPFGSENVHDWVNGFLIRGFGNDVVWEGSTFRGGQNRPGIYLDREALQQIEHDERTILTLQETAYRASIVGMAPKHLQEVPVPGEVANVTVVTAEKGESIARPLVGAKVETPAVADPKKEADDNTLLYLLLGVGGIYRTHFCDEKLIIRHRGVARGLIGSEPYSNRMSTVLSCLILFAALGDSPRWIRREIDRHWA